MKIASIYLCIAFILISHEGFSQWQSNHTNFGLDTTQEGRYLDRYKSYNAFFLGEFSNTSKEVPFWLRANQAGSVPISGSSINSVLYFSKEYNEIKKRKLDWGSKVEARLNLGKKAQFILVQAYLKAKFYPFQLKIGRSRDQVGLSDSTLSSGSFSVSGNALGVPKIELSIPEFVAIPGLKDLFHIKGTFSLGAFGQTQIGEDIGNFMRSDVDAVNSMYHQKSLYGLFGKNSWRLNLIAGFNHQTMFGNEEKIFNDFNLSKFQALYYAVLGKTWYDNNGANTKLGNQIGSIDFGATYKLKDFEVFAYRQQFYDVGALAHLANVRDGLTGISLKRKVDAKNRNISLNKLVFEYFYSKNQAGESWSKLTPSGDEDYYNNFMYLQGWSYKGRSLGSPLITPRHEAKVGQRYKKDQYFINNRVIAYHVGLQLTIGHFDFLSKITFSQNFGTYGTSSLGSSRNKRRFPLSPPYFEEVNQFSGYLKLARSYSNGWTFSVSSAFDVGLLLEKSHGLTVSAKKDIMF